MTFRVTYAEPDDDVGVGGRAGAASKLLLAGRAHDDGVLQGSLAAGVEGAHVEDVDALHLSEDFQTLKTGGLLEIGRDGAGLGTGSDEVLVDLDLWNGESSSRVSNCQLKDAWHGEIMPAS